MDRMEIMNTLIDKEGYETYLEIGYDKGKCFENITCPSKTTIDPDLDEEVQIEDSIYVPITSDEYFSSIGETEQFDIIFIDGLHHREQFKRDVKNSLKHLSANGTIVCHDCAPKHEERTRVPRETGQWNGDVFRGWMDLRQEFFNEGKDIEMFVIPRDQGCGIIRSGINVVFGDRFNCLLNPLRLDVDPTFDEYLSDQKSLLGMLDTGGEFIMMISKNS